MAAAHWQFVLERAGAAKSWTWRQMRVDGAIERISESCPYFGRAVMSAVRNGFQPKRDSWVIIAGETCTHFAPGQLPASIPPDAPDVPTSPKAVRPKRTKERRSAADGVTASPVAGGSRVEKDRRANKPR